MERLLAATLAVIEENGLADVTIPAIAAAAGLSTGSVYRRFNDKDALIRGAFLRLLEDSEAANQASLTPDRFQGLSFDQALKALCHGLVAQYRERAALLKALDQFIEVQTDEAFEKRAVDMIAANILRVVEAMLPFRKQIAAADAERAITFALLSAATLIEVHKLHVPRVWQRMLPLDDVCLAEEAARTMAAYLASAD